MKNKNNIGKQTRGCIPNNPRVGIINSAKDRKKTHRRVTLPLSRLGAFMIVPALLSAIFGLTLVSVYLTLPYGEPGQTIFYTGLGAGVLSLGAFALGLYSGLLLLAGKHFGRAVSGMVMIFSFGVATLLIPLLEGLPLQSGVIVATPMIVSSVIALAWTALNMANQRTKPIIQKTPLAARERVFAGLGVAGGGLILLGIVFHFTPMYPFYADRVVLVIGASLLVAAFLVRRTYKH
jgi:hypothetical protein